MIRARRAVLAAAAALLSLTGALAGCSPGADREDGGGGAASGSAPAASDGGAVRPLENPDGTGPGLAPITSETDRDRARRLLALLTTKGRGPRTGYARDEFGYAWMDTADGVPLARNGCDTRNDLLARDGRNLRFRSGSDCVVVSMTLHDPYTDKTIEWRKQNAAEVQIDHVVPLSYSWQMGAARWDRPKRERLANDVLNLMPVSGPANSAKGDSGPASWLPPSRAIRCSYAVRFAQVAVKYELPVTVADKRAMTAQCEG